MAIKSSGELTLADIFEEFDKSSQTFNFADFYRGHGKVPNILRNKKIPSNSQENLSLDMFYNASREYLGFLSIDINHVPGNETGNITITGIGTSLIWEFYLQGNAYISKMIPNKQNTVTWNTGPIEQGWHTVKIRDEADWHYYNCFIGDNSSYVLGKGSKPNTGWFPKTTLLDLLYKKDE